MNSQTHQLIPSITKCSYSLTQQQTKPTKQSQIQFNAIEFIENWIGWLAPLLLRRNSSSSLSLLFHQSNQLTSFNQFINQIKCLWFELDWWWIEWRCFYLCFIVHQPIIPFHFIIAFFSIRKGQPQPQQTSFLHPAHSEELEWKEKKCCWWRAASSSSAVHSKLSENLQFSSSLFISALRFARITVIILFYSFQLNQLQQSEVDYRSIHKKESFSCFYSVVPFIQTNSTKQSNSIHPSIKCLWLNGMNWLLFCELFDLRHSASWIHQIYFINSLHSFHYIHKLRRQCPSILFFSSFSSLGRAEMKRKKGIEWAAAVILAPAPRGSPNATSIDFTNSIH